MMIIRKSEAKTPAGISFKFKITCQIIIALIGIFILTYYVNSSELKKFVFSFFQKFNN